MKRAPVLAALAFALVVPAQADAGRYAVGVDRGVSIERVALAVEKATGGSVSRELAPMRALVVDAPSVRGIARLPHVAYVERLDTRRRVAFAPRDPLATRQWYLPAIRAFDAWVERPPSLRNVRVAVIDSGIDADHPDLASRIVGGRSFVGGSWRTDQQGHGTFVAGIIAAAHNEHGIAGVGFPAQLLVAKIVRADGSISLEAEAAAIRWAVANGAQVINMSLAGLRDPLNPRRDTYSPLEAAAVSYAASRDVVLVAATGNADQAPARPWKFASYPAALPHVIGVSALARDGSVPTFSDRDSIFNDLSAPGQDIYSTFPRQLTAFRGACPNQGYSDCAPEEYRRAEGTSFAAPQVAGAAAVLLAAKPALAAEQVATLLTRSAADVNVATGCRPCPFLRDALSGWGRLDVTAAVAQAQQSWALPPADRYETNDDAGTHAPKLYGRRRQFVATIDYWDDQTDVYRVYLREGEQLAVTLRRPARTDTKLVLWRPGTRRVEGMSVALQRMKLRQSARRGATEFVTHRAKERGWHYVQVKAAAAGSGAYTLSYSKSR